VKRDPDIPQLLPIPHDRGLDKVTTDEATPDPATDRQRAWVTAGAFLGMVILSTLAHLAYLAWSR